MAVEFQSFVLPPKLRRLWKKAAGAEGVSKSEFLRRALTERATRMLAETQRDPQVEHERRSGNE